MRRWLARLAFSFIVLAIAFAYEGYRLHRGDRGPGRETRAYLFFAAAAVCFGLGLRGMRERHRSDNEPDDDPTDREQP